MERLIRRITRVKASRETQKQRPIPFLALSEGNPSQPFFILVVFSDKERLQ